MIYPQTPRLEARESSHEAFCVPCERNANGLSLVVQVGGIVAEALRLVMVQRILSSPEFKMDPLVSIYYYAPACAAINGVVTLFVEIPRMTMNDIWALGVFTLLVNALVAFLLNVSVVLLVRTSISLSPSFLSLLGKGCSRGNTRNTREKKHPHFRTATMR